MLRQRVARNVDRVAPPVARVAGSRRGRQATPSPVSVATGHRVGCRDGGLVPTSGIRLVSAQRGIQHLSAWAVYSSRFRASGREELSGLVDLADCRYNGVAGDEHWMHPPQNELSICIFSSAPVVMPVGAPNVGPRT